MTLKFAILELASTVLRGYIRYSPVGLLKGAAWKTFEKFIGWRNDMRPRVASTRFRFRVNVRLPDLIQEVIYLTGQWEPYVTSYFRRTLSPGDTFIDIGANIGWHSLVASRVVGESGRVYSIEGSPSTFRCLQGNIALNEMKNVWAIQSLVGDEDGEKDFWMAADGNIGHSTTIEALAVGEGMRLEARVTCGRLTTLVPPEDLFEARLIKVDVEGAERAVLESIIPLLHRFSRRTVWAVELGPEYCPGGQSDVDWVYRGFLDAGYQAFTILNDYSITTHLARPADVALIPMTSSPKTISDVIFLRH